MKLYRLKCGCVGLKPRVCENKPQLMKMTILYDCHRQHYCFNDIVTGVKPTTRLGDAAASVAARQISNLIEKGRTS